jgi:hypothetical protein
VQDETTVHEDCESSDDNNGHEDDEESCSVRGHTSPSPSVQLQTSVEDHNNEQDDNNNNNSQDDDKTLKTVDKLIRHFFGKQFPRNEIEGEATKIDGKYKVLCSCCNFPFSVSFRKAYNKVYADINSFINHYKPQKKPTSFKKKRRSR